LFEKGRSTITEHLKNIFETGELDENSVCREFRHTAEDGKEYNIALRATSAENGTTFQRSAFIFGGDPTKPKPFAIEKVSYRHLSAGASNQLNAGDRVVITFNQPVRPVSGDVLRTYIDAELNGTTTRGDTQGEKPPTGMMNAFGGFTASAAEPTSEPMSTSMSPTVSISTLCSSGTSWRSNSVSSAMASSIVDSESKPRSVSRSAAWTSRGPLGTRLPTTSRTRVLISAGSRVFSATFFSMSSVRNGSGTVWVELLWRGYRTVATGWGTPQFSAYSERADSMPRSQTLPVSSRRSASPMRGSWRRARRLVRSHWADSSAARCTSAGLRTGVAAFR